MYKDLNVEISKRKERLLEIIPTGGDKEKKKEFVRLDREIRGFENLKRRNFEGRYLV
jgi:hypothetical protein